jgi:hypothetical protein
LGHFFVKDELSVLSRSARFPQEASGGAMAFVLTSRFAVVSIERANAYFEKALTPTAPIPMILIRSALTCSMDADSKGMLI